VFNATFNNISVILWRSVLKVEETRVSTVTASGMDSGNIMELKATFKVLYHHVYFEVKYGYIQ
jgi:hypothetical protein